MEWKPDFNNDWPNLTLDSPGKQSSWVEHGQVSGIGHLWPDVELKDSVFNWVVLVFVVHEKEFPIQVQIKLNRVIFSLTAMLTTGTIPF